MKPQRAFTLLEVAIVTPIMLFVLGVTISMINASTDATRVHRIQAGATHTAAATVDRLSLELGQTTTETSPTLGSKKSLETDGIRFRRVVGVGISASDHGEQIWSDEIVVHWDRAEQVITRSIGGNAPVVIARDITDFSCLPNAEGQFLCMVECTKTNHRGQSVAVRRTFRATPMNKLQ